MNKEGLPFATLMIVVTGLFVIAMMYFGFRSPAPVSAPATITYTDAGFEPSAVTVQQHATVTFKNESSHPLQLISQWGQSYLSCYASTSVGNLYGTCSPVPVHASWSVDADLGFWEYHDILSSSTATATIMVQPGPIPLCNGKPCSI